MQFRHFRLRYCVAAGAPLQSKYRLIRRLELAAARGPAGRENAPRWRFGKVRLPVDPQPPQQRPGLRLVISR
jgi:hypothetical protein